MSAYELGTIHVGLQDHEQALNCLEEAYIERSGWMPYLAIDPRLAPLRGEARFQRLLRCVSNRSQDELLAQYAQEFSSVLGRTIQYVNVPPQIWETRLREARLPDHM